jgi:hypothetical protein
MIVPSRSKIAHECIYAPKRIFVGSLAYAVLTILSMPMPTRLLKLT